MYFSPPHRWFRCTVPDIDGALVQGVCGVEDAAAGRGSYQVKGLCLSLKQFFALLVKRLHHTTRSYKDFFAQVTPPGRTIIMHFIHNASATGENRIKKKTGIVTQRQTAAHSPLIYIEKVQ